MVGIDGTKYLGESLFQYPPKCDLLLQNLDFANMCFGQPADVGIFQVQTREFDYIVDIGNKTCDYRRWDLIGIPCNHAIACLRHERILVEDMLPSCYSTETYSNVYAFNIMPCRDKTMWEKMNGPLVQPPIYEKRLEGQQNPGGSNLLKCKEGLGQSCRSMG